MANKMTVIRLNNNSHGRNGWFGTAALLLRRATTSPPALLATVGILILWSTGNLFDDNDAVTTTVAPATAAIRSSTTAIGREAMVDRGGIVGSDLPSQGSAAAAALDQLDRDTTTHPPADDGQVRPHSDSSRRRRRPPPRHRHFRGNNATTLDRLPSSSAVTPAGGTRRRPPPQSSESSSPNATTVVKSYPTQCTLYLAPSTIPNSGLGMFTSIPLPPATNVGSPDITIPVWDLNWHNDNFYQLRMYHMLYENYFWSATTLGVGEAEVVGVMSMGFGSLANSHLGLKNLEEGKPVYNVAGLHRDDDVGVGAFCPYHGRDVKTTTDVPAGAELFVDYGTNWFTTRRAELGYIPLEKDYVTVDKFLKKYDKFESTALANASFGMKEDLWNLIINFRTRSPTLNAMPNSTSVAKEALKSGVLSTVRQLRSTEWLEQNGKCLDNIRVGRSTIRQAGRGAFATRSIPKGKVVISTPLIHIPRGRDVFRMYEMNNNATTTTTNSDGAYTRDPKRVAGHQLILNYCYGNANSTVLLSPYGPSVSFINHRGTNYNAEVRWSDLGNGPRGGSGGSGGGSGSGSWYDRSVTWLEKQFGAIEGLAFDFVATRDIEPGEEVFINYGSEWHEAWDRHVENWVPPPTGSEEKYRRASELDKDPDFDMVRTVREQVVNPYPSHVETYCRYRLTPQKKGGGSTTATAWKAGDQSGKLHPCEILVRSNVTTTTTTMTRTRGGGSSSPPSMPTPTHLYQARILNRRTKLGRFGKVEKMPGVPRGEDHVLTNIPRRGIELVDRMYSSDMHLANAFRHEIMIPDDMFPKAWRNL